MNFEKMIFILFIYFFKNGSNKGIYLLFDSGILAPAEEKG